MGLTLPRAHGGLCWMHFLQSFSATFSQALHRLSGDTATRKAVLDDGRRRFRPIIQK